MVQNRYLTFLYKRVLIDEDDKYCTYVYEYDGVVVAHGEEGKVSLSFEDNDYYFIGDANYMENENVFAFPYELSEEEFENIEEIKDSLKDVIETVSSNLFYQVHEKGSNEVRTYYLDTDENNVACEVNMGSLDGINDIFDENRRRAVEVSFSLKKALIDAKKEDKNLTSEEIYEELSKKVMCQDEQIKVIISNIMKNGSISDSTLKSNLFICGETGTGKTEIFRCLEDYLDVPVVIKNITTMNETTEKCISELLYNLYAKANGDIEKVQRGVVVIDGIDEQIKCDKSSRTTNLFLDEVINASKGLRFSFNNDDVSFEIDTSFITFVFISNYLDKMGYVYQESSSYEGNINHASKTLTKCGLDARFSRDCNVVAMNTLNLDDLCKIINESEKSVFLLYKYMIEEMGIKLLYDEECINTIARKAHELGVGIHSLKPIVEKAFEVILYHVYSGREYSEVIITSETFDDNKKFILK